MARHKTAAELRVSSRDRTAATSSRKSDDGKPSLRLVVTRGRLGVELDGDHSLGPLTVEQLSATFAGVRFPVELSGGVDAFRNKRGELESMQFRVDAEAIAKLSTKRLRGIVGRSTPHFVCAAIDDGFLIGVSADDETLAFEVLVAPMDGDIRLIAVGARGIGLSGPAQLYALRVLSALVKPVGRLVGGVVVIETVAKQLLKHVMPRAGMRIPSSKDVVWSGPNLKLTALGMTAERHGSPAALSERVLSAVELAALVAEAEQALASSDLEHARRAYLEALHQAPRHTEIARRLAEVDASVGGRAEAGLGTLTDSMQVVEFGIVGGRLLAEVGDTQGARAAFERAAATEPFGALASAIWLELAEVLEQPEAIERALDEAVVRAPASARARWARFERRLKTGQVDEAMADAEHLEAAARGPHERHAVIRRAAERFMEQRDTERAALLFERALRYLPDSVDGVAGFARALQAIGKRKRALSLLSRAVGLAERASRPAHRVTVDLARALVDVAGDRPAAIAHVRQVPPWVAETFEARLLEGRWRAELGDAAGCSVALGLLGDSVEQALGLLSDGPESSQTPFTALWGPDHVAATRRDAQRAVAALLEEAARMEEFDRQDKASARRLYGLALRLEPASRTIGRAYARLHADAEALIDRAAPTRVLGRENLPDETPTRVLGGDALLDEGVPRAETESLHESPLSQDPLLDEPAERSSEADEEHSDIPSGTLDAIPAFVPEDEPESAISVDVASARQASFPGADPFGLDSLGDVGDADDEILVDQLSEKLRANPEDMQIVRELAAGLERLGRDMELLALLSARIEEGSDEARKELIPLRRQSLGRLVERAERQGRDTEASLYRSLMADEADSQ